MTALRFLVRHPVKAKRIKLTMDCTCEVCGRRETLEDLEIHSFLEEEEERCAPADLEAFLILVCTSCHWDLHAYGVSVPEQTVLVQGRAEGIREAVRAILAYVPKPYTPPESDIETIFREAIDAQHSGFGV